MIHFTKGFLENLVHYLILVTVVKQWWTADILRHNSVLPKFCSYHWPLDFSRPQECVSSLSAQVNHIRWLNHWREPPLLVLKCNKVMHCIRGKDPINHSVQSVSLCSPQQALAEKTQQNNSTVSCKYAITSLVRWWIIVIYIIFQWKWFTNYVSMSSLRSCHDRLSEAIKAQPDLRIARSHIAALTLGASSFPLCAPLTKIGSNLCPSPCGNFRLS